MRKTQELIIQIKKVKPINILFLILAGFINAVGVSLLLMPAGLLDGGLSGTSILLSRFTPLNFSIFLIILNIPFYLIAFKRLGADFIIYSLIAILSYSLFSYLFTGILIPKGYLGKFYPITSEILLCAVFGGLVSGVGSGLTIRSGGSLDGAEVMAVMLHKRLGLSVGQFVMIYNVIIFLIGGFLLGFDIPLYSIIAYAIGVKAVDGIVEGLDKEKAFMVITNHPDEVAGAVSATIGRGVTILKGRGFYSGEDKSVIYYVVNRFQITKIKKVIKDADPESFVSIIEVSEVIGGKSVRDNANTHHDSEEALPLIPKEEDLD